MPPKKTPVASAKDPDREVFADTFNKLRAILKKYEAKMTLKEDKPDSYYLDAGYSEKWKRVLFFGAVQIKKNYVSYHFMPIYMCADLQSGMSQSLKKRMQGKACFNFKDIEPSHVKELAELTRKGFDQWKKLGFI